MRFGGQCWTCQAPTRSPYDRVLPHAHQVADPFHVVRLANRCVDLVRRRVQNETLGHRRRRGDPLYRIRRLLIMASERLDDRGEKRIQGLLRAGDPYGEVRDAWYAKEGIRDIYQIGDPQLAAEFTHQLSGDLQDRSLPREVNRLGRTIARWATPITNWHHSAVTNGPTEGLNNLIKRIKRAAFGFSELRQLQNQSTPIRWQAELAAPRNDHSPLISTHTCKGL